MGCSRHWRHVTAAAFDVPFTWPPTRGHAVGRLACDKFGVVLLHLAALDHHDVDNKFAVRG